MCESYKRQSQSTSVYWTLFERSWRTASKPRQKSDLELSLETERVVDKIIASHLFAEFDQKRALQLT